MENSILRLQTVLDLTGLSRSALYAAMQTGSFPRPVSIGKRAVGWLYNEVRDWISSRQRVHKKKLFQTASETEFQA